MDRGDDFRRTIAYGDAALGQMKANRTPAYPRNYEFWYTYSAGFNKSLNDAVNDCLRQRGYISQQEVSELYEKHLSPLHLGDRVEVVGARIADEIDRVMEMISNNASSTSSYGASLEGATQALDQTQDQEQVRSIVQTLIQATKSIETNNSMLQAQLVASKREIDELHESLEAVRHESMTDDLTALANRKQFQLALARLLRDAQKTDTAFVLLLADIDHFKRFNDTYGHQTGDQVLRLVAASMKQCIKGKDVAARFGGEEFAVILPGTDIASGALVADQIRCAVMAKELVKRSTGQELGRITVSIGCAQWHPGDTAEGLIARADEQLYIAKNAGRNRVSSEADALPDISQNVA